MNSIDRVKNCIDRKPIDAVPLGFYMVDHDTISKVIGRPTYVRNSVALQIAFWEGRRDEVVESMKSDLVDFYRKIDLCDIITFKESWLIPPKGYKPEDPPKKNSDTHWKDKAGRVFLLSQLSNEFICVEDPTTQGKKWSKEDFPVPTKATPPDPTTLELYDHMVSAFQDTRYIAGATAGAGSILHKLGGMENGLMHYIESPDLVEAYTRYATEMNNLQDEYYLRPGISGAFLEADFCSTKGTLISPDMWQEYHFPSLQSRVNHLKSLNKNLQFFFHSCGNTRQVLNLFAEAGIQVYQSIQTIPAMQMGDLKRDFGAKLVLWGGVPVEELILGTPDQVRASVRKTMDSMRGGGLILGSSHSIAYGTKYDNFMAMLDEFDKLRFRM